MTRRRWFKFAAVALLAPVIIGTAYLLAGFQNGYITPGLFNFSSVAANQCLVSNSSLQFVNQYCGIPIDVRSGASVTITGDTTGTDRLTLVWLTNNTTSTAVTLPQAGSTNFGSNFTFTICNDGAVTATITPTTSTINGQATLTLPALMSNAEPFCAAIYSDNTNYYAFAPNIQPFIGGSVTMTADYTIASAGSYLTIDSMSWSLPSTTNSTPWKLTCALAGKTGTASTTIGYAIKFSANQTSGEAIGFTYPNATLTPIVASLGGSSSDIALAALTSSTTSTFPTQFTATWVQPAATATTVVVEVQQGSGATLGKVNSGSSCALGYGQQ